MGRRQVMLATSTMKCSTMLSLLVLVCLSCFALQAGADGVEVKVCCLTEEAYTSCEQMVILEEVILEEVILEAVPMMADLLMTMAALLTMQEPLTTMEVVMTQDRVMMMEVVMMEEGSCWRGISHGSASGLVGRPQMAAEGCLLKEMCLQVSCRCWRRRSATWLRIWMPETFTKLTRPWDIRQFLLKIARVMEKGALSKLLQWFQPALVKQTQMSRLQISRVEMLALLVTSKRVGGPFLWQPW